MSTTAPSPSLLLEVLTELPQADVALRLPFMKALVAHLKAGRLAAFRVEPSIDVGCRQFRLLVNPLDGQPAERRLDVAQELLEAMGISGPVVDTELAAWGAEEHGEIFIGLAVESDDRVRNKLYFFDRHAPVGRFDPTLEAFGVHPAREVKSFGIGIDFVRAEPIGYKHYSLVDERTFLSYETAGALLDLATAAGMPLSMCSFGRRLSYDVEGVQCGSMPYLQVRGQRLPPWDEAFLHQLGLPGAAEILARIRTKVTLLTSVLAHSQVYSKFVDPYLSPDSTVPSDHRLADSG